MRYEVWQWIDGHKIVTRHSTSYAAMLVAGTLADRGRQLQVRDSATGACLYRYWPGQKQ